MDKSAAQTLRWLHDRWAWKHRPRWARFLPFSVWAHTVLFKSRWVPWSHAYRYRRGRV